MNDHCNIEAEKNVRKGLINVLKLFSSPEDQIEYQIKVPHVYVPHEMIEQWLDCVDHDRKDWYKPDVYSPEELEAIWSFDEVWDIESDRIDSSLTMEEMINSEPWINMINAARYSLIAFRKDSEQGGQPDAFGAGYL